MQHDGVTTLTLMLARDDGKPHGWLCTNLQKSTMVTKEKASSKATL